ncbi:MAG: dihydrofolate reductase family protein [Phycisphaerae bacterium]|nr:dihydrofolate reductase family protein [Phycisphaerae bacterium]
MNRPYTFMLVAMSLDGKISPRRHPGQPNPIGPTLIHEKIMTLHNAQRSTVDGIMVGLNCILLDDSRLTLRDNKGTNPTRIVLDGLAEISPQSRILDHDAPTIIAVTQDAPARKVSAFKDRGAHVVKAGQGKYVDLPHLMKVLYEDFHIKRLMVEGGGTVHRSMITAGLYDELQLIMCPFVMGGSASISPVERSAFWPRGHVPKFTLEKAEIIENYLYIVYTPEKEF